MGKWRPIDQAFAEIEKRQEGTATTKNEALTNAVRGLERSRHMPEETCKVEGCEEECVPHRGICRKHYNEQQKKYSKNRKRSSGERKPAGKPKRETESPPKSEEPVFRVGLQDLLGIVGVLGSFNTDEEARAYLLGFFRGREIG